MLAQLHSLAIRYASSMLVMLGLGAVLPAEAAFANHAPLTHTAYRGVQWARTAHAFRPVEAARILRGAPMPVRRDSGVVHTRSWLPQRRAGARKAVPITRGQELGLRFRPDERESPYAVPAPYAGDAPGDAAARDLQSQFRPIEKKHRRTYEEMQAENVQPVPMPAPILPYPSLPPPPAFVPFWPN